MKNINDLKNIQNMVLHIYIFYLDMLIEIILKNLNF